MSTPALFLILLSAFLHAGWNAMMKRIEDRFCLMVGIHIIMAVGLSPFLARRAVRQLAEVPTLIIPLSLAAVFFALYHLFLVRSYERGDLSLVYPLTTMAPALVPLWGWLWLGERLTAPGFAGIGLVLAGAYAVQFRRLSLKELAQPLRRKDSAVLMSLAAAFFYSLGSAVDKAGIDQAEVLPYSYLLILAMVVTEVPMAAGMGLDLGRFMVDNIRYLLGAALVLMVSFLTYRFGLKVTDVSYAASVRQVNALFGVILGLTLFREPFGRYRLAAAILIVAGVVTIKMYG
ncbi:MAG: EamA family transporter [bacterium]|nr:MAG: EamA family transporter [bacterium]